MNYGRWGRHQLRKKRKLEKKCWFNNVTLYEDKLKSDRDIFRWDGWTYFTGPFTIDFTRAWTAADLLIKAEIPPGAQAKPKEDGSEGEKIINQWFSHIAHTL